MSRPKSPEPASVPSVETLEDRAAEEPPKHSKEKPEKCEDDTEYPNLLAIIFITFGLCFAIFLPALDQTVISTAIPKITDQFNSLDDVSWYGAAYLMTMSCFQLPVGKLYTLFPTKWCFVTAIAIFETGSAICGGAPNSTALIVGRAIAGMGCAGIVSGAFVIISKTVPLSRRPMFIGVIGSMAAIAMVCGPPIGGALTDRVSWRWCFFINLPLGGFTITMIVLLLRPLQPPPSQDRTIRSILHALDLPGISMLLPAVVTLILALTWGGLKYPWSNWRIILLLVISSVAFITFTALQFLRPSNATVPGHLLTHRSIICACIVAACMGAGMLTVLYFLPLYFQAIKRASPVHSGIMILATVISDVGFAIIAGTSVTAIGYYTPFMLLGAALFTAGASLLHTLTLNTATATWVGYQVLLGAGAGMITQQPNIAVQAVLPSHEIPIATALVVFFQTLGGAVFLAISQAIFDAKLVDGLKDVLPGGSESIVEEVLRSGAVDLASAVPPQDLAEVLGVYARAVAEPFVATAVVGGVAFLASLGMEWVSVKGRRLLGGIGE